MECDFYLVPVRRFDHLARIAELDPHRDYAEIYRLMVFHEFPWDLRTAGKLMIWHLYALPSTARVVGSTDALLDRAEGTALTFGDLIEHGLDSPQGRATIGLVNRSHRGWPISTEDHRYALAGLTVTTLRWLDRHGWRRPSTNERIAVAVFYAELGRRMGVPDLPRDPDVLAAFLSGFERDRLAHTREGRQCSERTIAMAGARVPRPLAPLVGPAIAALLDDPVRAAVGLPRPGRAVRWSLRTMLSVRRRLLRFLPPRRVPTTPRTRRGLPPLRPGDPLPAAGHHAVAQV
ncbi:oxygenase MpaB family protein [Polymorphospora rubra]